MAAIDIIQNMTNGELVNYYKYCMVERYYEFRNRGVSFHPDYQYCKVYAAENTLYNLHYSNEEYLLKEMWYRYMTDSFVNQCWWKAMKIFQTNISLPYKENKVEETIETKIEPKPTETISYNNTILTLIGTGTKRKTYLSEDKTYVIKVPQEPTKLGIQENITEADIYTKNPNTIYAKCELLDNNWLKMEYVKPIFFSKDDEYPDWILTIAEAQVGYNLNGVLVAYDYGSDI